MAFSPDGRWLATGSADKTVRLWDWQAGTAEPVVLRGHEDAVSAVAFSPDGRWLATGSEDKTVRPDWQAGTAEPVVLRGHEDTVMAVAFSPDGRWLATGSGDKTVAVGLAGGHGGARGLAGPRGAVWAVAFSPDGRWLATGSRDKTVRLWDWQAARRSPWSCGPRGWVWAVAFSPDGRWLAGQSDKTVRLWRIQVHELIQLACQIANRNLTRDEWQRLLGNIPYHKTCGDLPVHPSVYEPLLKETEELTKQGKITSALETLTKVQRLEPAAEISADTWYGLCWFGSLWEAATEVMHACDKVGAVP